MKKIILLTAIIMVVGSSGITHAMPMYSFDYDHMSSGDSQIAISNYMSDMYGSDVTVQNAHVYGGSSYNQTSHMLTSSQGFMDMQFEMPISQVTFDGYVSGSTMGAIFHYEAYDENDQMVDSKAWYVGDDTPFTYNSDEYETPIYRLQLSNSGLHDIGVDNVQVTSSSNGVPVPGSIMLGSIGMVVVNWLRRRRTI